MTSAELAERVEGFIRACKSRVMGTGNDQYSTAEGQAFERMSPLELVRMAREEAQDGAVYMAMLDVQLAKLEEALVAKL